MAARVEETAVGHALALARAKQARVATRRAFRLTYRDRPDLFVADCFAWEHGDAPTEYQVEILHNLVAHGREAARGCHGVGKTAISAWAVHWYFLTRDGEEDWKMPTTASSWRQLTHFLWPEIRKWARRIRWDRVGRGPYDPRTEMFQLNLKGETGEAFAVAATAPELIEGAHADCLLFLYDESKAIPDAIFDASEGAFSGAGGSTGREALALAMSTPGVPQGRFYDINARKPGFEDWFVRFVQLDEAIKAGRVSTEWVEARRRQWGEQSPIFQNRVLGEFADVDEAGVIPLSWIEAAQERWHARREAPRGPLTAVGADVADTGADNSVLARRYGTFVEELSYLRPDEDTMAAAGYIAGPLLLHGGVAVVDVIGVGAGVVSRLRERRVKTIAFNASERAAATDLSGELGFINKRAHAWWHLRELLDPDNGHDIALPPDDRLTGDLAAPRWTVTSGGKIQIESKDDIRKRLGRSTDAGDAVAHAFYADFNRDLPLEGISLVTMDRTSPWRV